MITILGAGPGGLMLARMLTLRNIPFQILEADDSPSARPQGGMLNINEDSGLPAIRHAGLLEQVLAEELRGGDATRIMDSHGTVHLDLAGNGKRPEIERGTLRRLLIESLPPGKIRWACKVRRVEKREESFVLVFEDGHTEEVGFVVGADGAWSKVRPLVTDARPEYSGVSIVELKYHDVGTRCPAASRCVGDGILFAPGKNHGFVGHREPRDEIQVGAVIQVPEEWKDRPLDLGVLHSLYPDWSPDFHALLDESSESWFRPIYALPIGLAWPSQPNVTLIGDAAHLMSPFAGEGVNLAITDGWELGEAIARNPGDWATAIREYEEAMLRRSHPVAVESKRNLEDFVSGRGLEILVEAFRMRRMRA